jgi:hypothetical protein
MANANVKWLKSQKGTEKLTVDDYLFQSNGKGKAPGVRYWTCATPGCKVNAKTEGTDLVEIRGLNNPPDHGHINDTVRIKQMNLTVGDCNFK